MPCVGKVGQGRTGARYTYLARARRCRAALAAAVPRARKQRAGCRTAVANPSPSRSVRIYWHGRHRRAARCLSLSRQRETCPQDRPDAARAAPSARVRASIQSVGAPGQGEREQRRALGAPAAAARGGRRWASCRDAGARGQQHQQRATVVSRSRSRSRPADLAASPADMALLLAAWLLLCVAAGLGHGEFSSRSPLVHRIFFSIPSSAARPLPNLPAALPALLLFLLHQQQLSPSAGYACSFFLCPRRGARLFTSGPARSLAAIGCYWLLLACIGLTFVPRSLLFVYRVKRTCQRVAEPRHVFFLMCSSTLDFVANLGKREFRHVIYKYLPFHCDSAVLNEQARTQDLLVAGSTVKQCRTCSNPSGRTPPLGTYAPDESSNLRVFFTAFRTDRQKPINFYLLKQT